MDNDYSNDSGSDVDSDRELQEAFKNGQLKGLVREVAPKPTFINNTNGLKAALAELENKLPWIERLDLVVQPIAPLKPMGLGDAPDDLTGDHVHDEHKREMKFHREAQAAVLQGIARLHKLGVPTERPKDFLAEMVKSDQHMDKVRHKLLSQKLSQERSEKAKKLRDNKKYGKKVQQEVLLNRQKEKKELLNKVKNFKKGKSSSLDFLDDRPKDGARPKSKENQTQNKKRQEKNKKFGFGGQKKRGKSNTGDSTNEVRAPRFTGKKTPGGNKNKSNKNRPGKKNRQKSKNQSRK